MQLVVSSAALEKAIRPIISIIPGKVMMPSIEFVRFDIAEKVLTITGTDLERTVRNSLEVETEESFSFLIKGRQFYDWLKLLDEHPITLSVSEDGHTIEAAITSGKYRFPSLPLEEFPTLPPFSPTSTLQLPEATLMQAISKTAFCMSNDTLRENMMGLFCEIKDGFFNFVATDTMRLSLFSIPMEGEHAEENFLIPAQSVLYLKGLLGDQQTPVAIEHDQGHARFTLNSIEVYTRLLDKRFPDYRVAIPAELPYHIEIGRDPMITAIRRVLVLTDKNQSMVRISIRGNEMIVRGEDVGFNTFGEEVINCQSNLEEFSTAFNGKGLLEIISAVEGENVIIKILADNKPIVFEPAEAPADHRHMMLTMPLLIQ